MGVCICVFCENLLEIFGNTPLSPLLKTSTTVNDLEKRVQLPG